MACPTSVSSRGKAKHFFLGLALLIPLLGGCGRRAEQIVPAHLIGTWKTDNPKYRDLFFEISSKSVIFNTAEGGLETYWISKTESSGQGNTSAHTLYGEGPGENFQFYYEAKSGGRLRFKNQIEIVWSKAAHGRH